MKLFAALMAVGSFALPVLAQGPAVPLGSDNRWIIDTNGDRVKLRCANWAGHMEANIPEGMHKQSVEYIADWIADNGFNCVRLTYAIDMALDPDRGVEDSFKQAAADTGVDEGALLELYTQAVEKNPWIADASRLDVFDRVQSVLWERGIMTILDNHVSKASWCCNLDDGNGWWADAPGYLAINSEFFDTQNWLDGLKFMAEWSVGKTGIVGMSLRNELRAHATQILWAVDTWMEYMPNAGNIVHAANPDLLVIIGALNGGTDLSSLRDKTMDTSGWAGKNVWEAHVYPFTVITPNFGNCDIEQTQYGLLFGFVLEQDHQSVGPLFLSEWGMGMSGGPNDGLSDEDHAYLTCLVDYMGRNDADWAHWALQGTYYVRDGQIDQIDNYAALDSGWNDWKNPAFPGMVGPMWEQTQGP